MKFSGSGVLCGYSSISVCVCARKREAEKNPCDGAHKHFAAIEPYLDRENSRRTRGYLTFAKTMPPLSHNIPGRKNKGLQHFGSGCERNKELQIHTTYCIILHTNVSNRPKYIKSIFGVPLNAFTTTHTHYKF